jgi:hypothetical protein
VSHQSIIRTFKHLGANEDLITLITNMYTGCTAAVIVNGWKTERFPLLRGTKQGDPLSPLIYALTVESLSRAFSAILHGYTSSSGVKFTHLLLFADDLVTFHTSYKDFHSAQNLLSLYKQGTGCDLNRDKCCSILPKGSSAKPPFKIPIQPERYLGFHFDENVVLSPQFPKLWTTLNPC